MSCTAEWSLNNTWRENPPWAGPENMLYINVRGIDAWATRPQR
jgi:hypothetical protein